MSTQLTFHNTTLNVVNQSGQIWLTSAELAKALQYSDSRSISKIYNTHSDEFTDLMSQVTESVTSGNYRTKQRSFSLRGAHLIAMFARTPVAKEFRKWVLDILDKEVGAKTIDRHLTSSEIRDYKMAINRCVERTKQSSVLINERVCERFNVKSCEQLLSSQLDEVFAYLDTLTAKEIIGKRYFVEIKITDYMFNGEKTIYARCNNFNALINGLAKDLGYKINGLLLNDKTLSI